MPDSERRGSAGIACAAVSPRAVALSHVIASCAQPPKVESASPPLFARGLPSGRTLADAAAGLGRSYRR
jgi:hypothetical protein